MIANKTLLTKITSNTTLEELNTLFVKDDSNDVCYTLDGNFKIKLLLNNNNVITLYATKINCCYTNKLHFIDLWKLGEFVATIKSLDVIEMEVYKFL